MSLFDKILADEASRAKNRPYWSPMRDAAPRTCETGSPAVRPVSRPRRPRHCTAGMNDRSHSHYAIMRPPLADSPAIWSSDDPLINPVCLLRRRPLLNSAFTSARDNRRPLGDSLLNSFNLPAASCAHLFPRRWWPRSGTRRSTLLSGHPEQTISDMRFVNRTGYTLQSGQPFFRSSTVSGGASF